MTSTSSRLAYLRHSARKLLAGRDLDCPSCRCPESTVSARRYIVTALRRCSNCHLLFRAPATTADENAAFYQHDYSQGFTTDLPSPAELALLKESAFAGTEKDYTQHVALLRAIGRDPGSRLFDYGCSWGYGSWQFNRAGYDVVALEISTPRADFARRHLGISTVTRDEDVRGSFDVFFSSHVLEHVPSVAESLQLARRLLKPDGWFVAITPNGCDAFRATNEDAWMKSWGLVHPNLLDDKFYAKAFEAVPSLIASTPFDLPSITNWASAAEERSATLDLKGSELLVVARRP